MKETIEEAAEKYAKQFYYAEDSSADNDFIEGANSDASRDYWFEKFQEQDNKLYSEKEVRDLFNLYKEEFSIYRNSQILNVQFEEWFNENKKQQ